MRAREVEALLADVLDPSRAVAPEFVNYILVTTEDKVLTGLLALETPVNVVIRGAEGKRAPSSAATSRTSARPRRA